MTRPHTGVVIRTSPCVSFWSPPRGTVMMVELSQPCSTPFQLSTSYCMLLNAPHTPFHSSLTFLLHSMHSPSFLNPHHLPFASVTNIGLPASKPCRRSFHIVIARIASPYRPSCSLRQGLSFEPLLVQFRPTVLEI